MHRDMELEKLRVQRQDVGSLDLQITQAKGKISEQQMIVDLLLEEGRMDVYDLDNVEYDDDAAVFSVSDQALENQSVIDRR